MWACIILSQVFGNRCNSLHRHINTLRTLCMTVTEKALFLICKPPKHSSITLIFFFFLRRWAMYVIPLWRRLRVATPDKSNLFHLVLNLPALHRGWLLLLLYSFVSSVCQRKKREREQRKEEEQREKKNTLESHVQRLQQHVIWMYNSVCSIHIQHRAPRTSISLILSKSN